MRKEGWESLLAEHIAEAENKTFAWGSHDCALWSARWVRACTGKDFASDWEGLYKTELGAKRLMRRRGFGGPGDIADEHLTQIPVRLARRGDLLLHPDGHLGICAGRTGHFLTADGVTALDTLACTSAWVV